MVKVLRSVVRGPLESYVAGFAEELSAQGYTRCSAEQHVCFVAHLDRWMLARHLAAGDLSGAVVDRYLTERRAAGYVNYRSGKAMRPLLDYLAAQGVLLPETVAVGPVEALLERYRCYLVGERGLTAGTARCYLDAVRPFVASRLRGDELDLAGLTAAEVSGFVLATCPGRATGTAKLIVTSLRSVLRFLHVEGLIPVPLAASVPSVAGWRLTGLPQALEPAQVRRLLASCDRRRARGRRDYAIVVLLVPSRVARRRGRRPRAGRHRLACRADRGPRQGTPRRTAAAPR